MKNFATLFFDLDHTNRSSEKISLLAEFFKQESPKDAAWAVYLLSGKKLEKKLPMAKLKDWIQIYAGIPDWLLNECYATTGDLAETITLLVPKSKNSQVHYQNRNLSDWIENVMIPLVDEPDSQQKDKIFFIWQILPSLEIFIFLKIITGGFRVGVQAKIVYRALEKAFGINTEIISMRAMGKWSPSTDFFNSLTDPQIHELPGDKPLPFYLASPLVRKDEDLEDQLGLVSEWIVEPKWDGIRGQLIHTPNQTYLWSRGEEIISQSFPEIVEDLHSWGDSFILDGEILPGTPDNIGTFSELQKRIGRKTVGKKLRKTNPVFFMAFDCLYYNQKDVRNLEQSDRRTILQSILQKVTHSCLHLSTTLFFHEWNMVREEIKYSRERGTEGFLLKRKTGVYKSGRVRGDWWKWKVNPLTLDLVLVYAQAGHGRRSGLFTDYTFAIWKEGKLVPLTKAYSGLNDQEMVQLDRWIKQNTLKKYGPSRQVVAEHVFEIAFEGVQVSKRHQSGLALRFPRIHSWRKDKTIEQSDCIEQVRAMIPKVN